MIAFDRVTREDLPELNELFSELVGSTADARAMAASFDEIHADPKVILLAARDTGDGGRLVGTAMGVVMNDLVWQCRPFMYVENVVVAAAARGRGVGRAMMSEMERLARELRCSYISLISSASRTDAHRFYESLGYADDPVRGFRKML